jgi:hypothetical protein
MNEMTVMLICLFSRLPDQLECYEPERWEVARLMGCGLTGQGGTQQGPRGQSCSTAKLRTREYVTGPTIP